MQNFGKVAVLMGGFSSEREVSLDSGAAILAALKSKGVDAHAFDPKEIPLSELKTQGFQTAFNTTILSAFDLGRTTFLPPAQFGQINRAHYCNYIRFIPIPFQRNTVIINRTAWQVFLC